MSDIPRARFILNRIRKDKATPPSVKRNITRALSLMTRVKFCRRASAKYKKIDAKMRRRIRYLARNYPDMAEHEIANAVGLRRGGTISEVLHGKR